MITHRATRSCALIVAVSLLWMLAACAPADATPAMPIAPSLPPSPQPTSTLPPTATLDPTLTPTYTLTPSPQPTHPLQIEVMRQQEYPGSEMVFEQVLTPGANYDRFIISYLSEGNKIYALLTIPRGDRPPTGWPVIIFNHGYIPPAQYRTTERYIAYVDSFARHGYIVLRSDYRGHGSSEGVPAGGYSSPAYTIDVLNAVSTIKRYPDADSNRIGMWGHSMGGQITLRSMVVTDDIKAGVIWAGVVASYPDLLEHWRRPASGPTNTPRPEGIRFGWRGTIIDQFGSPEENPEFWASISPNSYVADLSGPIQLHHGTEDESVPLILSELLLAEIQQTDIFAELYVWQGDDHNIALNFSAAMQRSIQFFDENVKGLADE